MSVDVIKSEKKLKEVLGDDLKFVYKIVLPVTAKKILNLSQECARELIRDLVKKELNQYLQRGVISPHKLRLSNMTVIQGYKNIICYINILKRLI